MNTKPALILFAMLGALLLLPCPGTAGQPAVAARGWRCPCGRLAGLKLLTILREFQPIRD